MAEPLADSIAPQYNLTPQTFYEDGPRAGKIGEDSQKVGWTLRDRNDNITAAFAFVINPQGITRGHSGRNQLFATKGGFYVDDFGVGPTTITISQLIASGKDVDGSGDFTARGDVVRWLQTIYLPASRRTAAGAVKPKVYFHDNHLDRGFEEQVYFPSQAVNVQRAVDLHNVWRVDITMMSLERGSLDTLTPERDARTVTTKRVRIQRGDTFHSIAYRLLGKNASAAKAQNMVQTLKNLNASVLKARTVTIGGKPVVAKAGQLVPGELFTVPVG